MSNVFSSLWPYGALFSHIAFVILVLAIIFHKSWGRSIAAWLGKHSLVLAFIVSLLAVGGSLYYSEIRGFEPCVLCWWQRVFLYPMPLILGINLWKKQVGSPFLYIVPLALLAALLAAYQSYVNLGGTSILPCTAEGSLCSRVYVLEFGYITIPLMSLTVSLYILLIAWAKKVYDKDSNA